jgi:hypothetical protein
LKQDRKCQKHNVKIGNGISRVLVLNLLVILSCSGCSSLRSILALPTNDTPSGLIHSPFESVAGGAKASEPMGGVILRTRKGDRSVEVELPKSEEGNLTDLTIPVSPAFRESQASRASALQGEELGSAPSTLGGNALPPPSMTDRQIVRAFPQAPLSEEQKVRSIEDGLGLRPSEDVAPESQVSYLASLDRMKSLYRQGRYEAALLESDELLKHYSTDPKLYEMRGTLLERVGQAELALQAWQQALRLNPKNESLRKFIDRRLQKRSLASP